MAWKRRVSRVSLEAVAVEIRLGGLTERIRAAKENANASQLRWLELAEGAIPLASATITEAIAKERIAQRQAGAIAYFCEAAEKDLPLPGYFRPEERP